jgi:riboflavin biosynthesis pyrimidine reductase
MWHDAGIRLREVYHRPMSVLRLYPPPQQKLPLHGLYLDLRLHRRAEAGQVFVYANFIASLDGRISLPDAGGEQAVPTALANRRDWRLYQELAAQADIMLTSARYFRQLAKGRAQDLLPIGHGAEYADLADWRRAEGLQPQPDVAILSRSLDIPVAALHGLRDRRILVLTGRDAAPEEMARLSAEGIRVIRCGEKQVGGAELRRLLVAGGYRSAYMIAGPEVHRSLHGGGLDMLFLSQRHCLLGGDDFRSIMQGRLDRPVEMQLSSLYLDETTYLKQRGGQSFACYEIMPQENGAG